MALRVPALEWTPLDWRLYARRAETEGGRGEFTAALADFRRARFLEPDYAGLPYEEGIFWLGVAPQFATEAWAEALRRVPAERRAEMYQNILANAFASHPELHAALWTLAAPESQMQLVYLGWAAPEEFTADLDELLRQDPALARFNTGQLRGLFAIWMNKGDPARLAGMIGQSPEWLKAGYRMLAEYDASREDFADAVGLMERYLPPRPMPRIPAPQMSRAEAAQRFQEDSGDVAAGMALYGEALAAGREEEALEALRRMSGNLGCPAYVYYLEGQLLVKEGKLGDAWAVFDKL